MGFRFNASEVFEMAKQIELNGVSFYTKAAENNPDQKDFLLEIAAQEKNHADIFAKLQEGIPADQVDEDFDPNNEAFLYLKAIADSNIFDTSKDPAEVLTGKETLEDIIKIAIGQEKDSISLYFGIQRIVSSAEDEERVKDIIKEEMKHLRWLSEKLR